MNSILRKIREKLIVQGDTRRYVLYAVGEIALVVIGILIALQVNNWNEERIRDQQSTLYTASLYNDLLENRRVVDQQIKVLLNDSTQISRQLERINSNSEETDTLIHIARNEFSSGFVLSGRLNDQTYQTLISSGKIEYLDEWVQKELAAFNLLNDDFYQANTTSVNFYLNGITSYMSEYTISDFEEVEGALQDAIWEGIDERHFIATFNKMVSIKKEAGFIIMRRLRPLKIQVGKMISYLEEQYPEITTN